MIVLLAVLLMVLVLIYLVDSASRGIRRRSFAWVYAGLLLACVASIAVGCGGGGSGGGGGGGSNHVGTAAGTYTLTVTGSDQGVQRTLTLSLTVN